MGGGRFFWSSELSDMLPCAFVRVSCCIRKRSLQVEALRSRETFQAQALKKVTTEPKKEAKTRRV
jgi:hypothetical protein